MTDFFNCSIMAVHAHPDDEALWTGLALARAARLGNEVTVVTCTLGEQGEVIGDKYASLEGTDLLGGYRIAELQRSLKALGLDRPVFLGGPGCWRDSGMAGTPLEKRSFAHPDNRDKEVEHLCELLRQHRPELVLTYGPDGGYGHPDHIRAHEITHEAVARVGGSRIMWAVTDRARVLQELSAVQEVPQGWVIPDEAMLKESTVTSVDFVLHSPEDLPAKVQALKAHATQVWVADGEGSDVNPETRAQGTPLLYALSNLIAHPMLDVECYQYGS